MSLTLTLLSLSLSLTLSLSLSLIFLEEGVSSRVVRSGTGVLLVFRIDADRNWRVGTKTLGPRFRLEDVGTGELLLEPLLTVVTLSAVDCCIDSAW